MAVMHDDWLLEEPDDSLPTQLSPRRVAPIERSVQIGTHKCHIVVVYSLSSGTGKTTIATNVAAALKREDERILLVDCALQSSDVGVFLNLVHQSLVPMSDLIEHLDNLDMELVNHALVQHVSGISVLLAPRTSQDAEAIAPLFRFYCG